MKNALLFLIKSYQLLVSPILRQVLGTSCRYNISCSEYALAEISRNGVLKGGELAVKRIVSCRPGNALSI